MDDHLVTVLICFAVFCVCMALYKLLSKGEKKLKQKQIEQTQSSYTPEQLKFLQTVKKLFRENHAMSISEIYKACGMPAEVAYSGDMALIEEHIPFIKGEKDHDEFMTYVYAINNRDQLRNSPFNEHPNDVLNLNLHPKEKIYHVIYQVEFLQEKTTVTNITYSGLRWASGPLRTGTLNVLTNEYTRFVPQDLGHLIFTNERLIFIGKQKNVTKQVKLDDILYCNLYQDGVMVHIPNRKPLLFKFRNWTDFESYQIADSINEFAVVYDRLRSGNYLDNLASPINNKKRIAFMGIEDDLKAKNYDPKIITVLSLAKVGEPIKTSEIQRRFEWGYNTAGKIIDQMEMLMFVTPNENGNREWLVDSNDSDMIGRLVDVAEPYPSLSNLN